MAGRGSPRKPSWTNHPKGHERMSWSLQINQLISSGIDRFDWWDLDYVLSLQNSNAFMMSYDSLRSSSLPACVKDPLHIKSQMTSNKAWVNYVYESRWERVGDDTWQNCWDLSIYGEINFFIFSFQFIPKFYFLIHTNVPFLIRLPSTHSQQRRDKTIFFVIKPLKGQTEKVISSGRRGRTEKYILV